MYTLNGKKYKIHTVTEEDVRRNPEIFGWDEIGDRYIILHGTYHFI